MIASRDLATSVTATWDVPEALGTDCHVAMRRGSGVAGPLFRVRGEEGVERAMEAGGIVVHDDVLRVPPGEGLCPFRAWKTARTRSGMTPCALTEADLPAAADLLARVGLSGASTMLRRYLRWQPDGVWKLELDGALAGTVTLLHQGSVGFVGCMAVHPARQGAGLGRRLL